MKKITIYNIVFAIIILIYLISIILNLCDISAFKFISVYWFQIFLGAIGILVLTRGLLFKLDASVFSGVALILIGVVLTMRDYFALPFHYVLAPLLANISIGLICAYIMAKNKLFLKSFLYSLIFVGLACIGYAF